MSLYYEAAGLLANHDRVGGSLKARVYRQAQHRHAPSRIFALLSESIKWSPVLKTVIESSSLLHTEKQKLNPHLALLLVHDLLLAKGGIVAPSAHRLRQAIERHAVRLKAEFTKARVRAGHATLEAFKDAIQNPSTVRAGDAIENGLEETKPEPTETRERQKKPDHKKSVTVNATPSVTTLPQPDLFPRPRWVRVNRLKTDLDMQLSTTFAGYQQVTDLSTIMAAKQHDKLLFSDPLIPDLLALPPNANLAKVRAFTLGCLVIQDKASCFPAVLLDPATSLDGDVIDACAAPGNKSVHLAAIVHTLSTKTGPASAAAEKRNVGSQVLAFERDDGRRKVLRQMIRKTGADKLVQVQSRGDFLAADPLDPAFARVVAVLLDPSCSGSGMPDRTEDPVHVLPEILTQASTGSGLSRSKKRKRKVDHPEIVTPSAEKEASENSVIDSVSERLEALAAFQLNLVEHAMQFPAARRIIYSTCSEHWIENEGVVAKALASDVAKSRHWRILQRDEQSALHQWPIRGNEVDNGKTVGLDGDAHSTDEDKADACLRCWKGTGDGTIGFFLAGFVRDAKITEFPTADHRQ